MFLRPVLEKFNLLTPEPKPLENHLKFGKNITDTFKQALHEIENDKFFAENRLLEEIAILPIGAFIDLPEIINSERYGQIFEKAMLPITVGLVLFGSYYALNPSVEVATAAVVLGFSSIAVTVFGTPIYFSLEERLSSIHDRLIELETVKTNEKSLKLNKKS